MPRTLSNPPGKTIGISTAKWAPSSAEPGYQENATTQSETVITLDLDRDDHDEVVRFLKQGNTTNDGKRGVLIFYKDEVPYRIHRAGIARGGVWFLKSSEITPQVLYLAIQGLLRWNRDRHSMILSSRLVKQVSEVHVDHRGNNYSYEIAQRISQVLSCPIVLIARVKNGMAESMTFLKNGHLLDDFQYPLAGAPCEEVAREQLVCIHTQGVWRKFPGDEILQSLKPECYLGSPILNSEGKTMGLLVALDKRPRPDLSDMGPAIEFCAGRIGAELERHRYERKREDIQRELENRVAERGRQLEAAQANLVKTAHFAGKAEIARGVLHHIGNMVNSLGISGEEIQSILNNSAILTLRRFGNLLLEKGPNALNEQSLPHLLSLFDSLYEEHERLSDEGQVIFEQLKLIKAMVKIQTDYAGTTGFSEQESLMGIINEATNLSSIGTNCGTCRFSLDNQVDKVHTIRAKLVHILSHLLNNAREALQDGKITDGRVQLKTYREQNDIVIEIRDNGPGFTGEVLCHAFELGYSTKAGGSGLGLHYCAIATKELGGKLEIGNAEEGGALITLRFPQDES